LQRNLENHWLEKPWVANRGVLKSKELTSRALPCLTLRDFHEVSRAAGPYSDMQQTSGRNFDRLPRTTAGFTTGAFDGCGLRDHLFARPAP